MWASGTLTKPRIASCIGSSTRKDIISLRRRKTFLSLHIRHRIALYLERGQEDSKRQTRKRLKLKMLTGNRAEWGSFPRQTSNGAGIAREWKFQQAKLVSDAECPANIHEAWEAVQDWHCQRSRDERAPTSWTKGKQHNCEGRSRRGGRERARIALQIRRWLSSIWMQIVVKLQGKTRCVRGRTHFHPTEWTLSQPCGGGKTEERSTRRILLSSI